MGSEFLQVAQQLHRFSEVIATSRSWDIENNFLGTQRIFMNLKNENFEVPACEYLVYCAGSVPQSGQELDGDWQKFAMHRVLDRFFDQGGRKAFVVSSGAVYESFEMPETGFEEAQWSPSQGVTAKSDYAVAKQLEEIVVEEFRRQGHSVAVGRLFSALGTRFSQSSQYAFVDFIQQQANEGAIRLQSPNSLRSFVWLPELALAVYLWLLNGEGEVMTFNVTGRTPVTLKQLALGLFPEGTLIEGIASSRHYFGNPTVMLSLPWFSDLMTSEAAIEKARGELCL